MNNQKKTLINIMKLLLKTGLLFISLFLISSSASFAQDNGKRGGDQKEKGKKAQVEKKVPNKADSVTKSGQAQAKADSMKKGKTQNKGANKGKAYGKNKEGMTGREFGQARAAAARNLEAQIDSLNQKVEHGEEVANKARTDIEEAEEELEENDAGEKEKAEQRRKLEHAKKQLRELEQLIATEKSRLAQARDKLSEISPRQSRDLDSEPDSTETGNEEEIDDTIK